MTATLPLWILWVVVGVLVGLAIGLAFVWGNFKEKRATGRWPMIKPMYDWRFALQTGEPEVSFIEVDSRQGSWAYHRGNDQVEFFKNNGITGWFGGTPEMMHVNDYWEVGGIIFRGRAQFEQLMKVKIDVNNAELERWREEAMLYKGLVEQNRHDPDVQLDKKIGQVGDLAKAAGNMAPKQKPGMKK